MSQIINNIRQRLSLREPLAEALTVVAKLTDALELKKPANVQDDVEYLKQELAKAKAVCPTCKDFERDFPSFAFSIATGIGKTRLMGACIAYLYLKYGIRHFFVLAPNLTLYEKLNRDFGDQSYEKYVFKGLAEFVHNPPVVITGDNYNTAKGIFSEKTIQINVFNIAKFNTDSKEGGKKGAPKMRRLSEYLGQSYFEYLSSLDDLVILMDEAHRYHADASKKAINELRPILGLEMTATPTDEKGKPFKNIVYEYNLAQALADGKYVKIPTVAKRRNFYKGDLSSEELDIIKLEDAISIHENTKLHLELYAKNYNQPFVKPFILVVCRDINHAKETFHRLEEDMFDSRYKGRVLQIDSSTKKSEDVDQLFVSLEHPDNRIEIVIHVNMLKEGWDVTNLYTIVPLRAADAPVLVEQSIGRGLRLPYGGKRTGFADIDKLTVIAHENFEAVIDRAKDPNSVLSKFQYAEIDEDELRREPSKIVQGQTKLDLWEKQELSKVKTEIEKKNVQAGYDARRVVWDIIPKFNSSVRSIKDLRRPEFVNAIKEEAKRKIEERTRMSDPLFASHFAEPLVQEVDNVVETVIVDYIKNIIEIPRMTVQREAFKTEFIWFDLDTSFGFSLPQLQDEIIRVGLVDNETEIIQAQTSRTYSDPASLIVSSLLNYDEIDYDKNAELLYHLSDQAIDAIKKEAGEDADIPKIISQFKKVIAKIIYDQMMRHFVTKSLGYTKPKVLPFTGIVQQHLTEVVGYGRTDFRDVVPPKFVPKFIFTGFLKSFYTECKFDSKTEQDFANVLEIDPKVTKWLRPASAQFNIYWANGSRRYEPDFIVETDKAIYMVETKAAKDITAADVQAKKKAADTYCENATEFTRANGGKPWKYVLLAHDKVDRTSSFDYMVTVS